MSTTFFQDFFNKCYLLTLINSSTKSTVFGKQCVEKVQVNTTEKKKGFDKKVTERQL